MAKNQFDGAANKTAVIDLQLVSMGKMEDMIISMLFNIVLPLPFIVAYVNYNNIVNERESFTYFKEKYNKIYNNQSEEEKAFKIFVNNLNNMTRLNQNVTDRKDLYFLNKFADIDPLEFEEHHAVTIKPYSKATGNEDNKLLESPNDPLSGYGELYDLDDSENLYEKYLKKFGKTRPLDELEDRVHFLRFVKTLVQLNRSHFEGKENRTLDKDADVVKYPHEYFY